MRFSGLSPSGDRSLCFTKPRQMWRISLSRVHGMNAEAFGPNA